MLSPDARSLYTGALTPPPGFVFDEAIGTTFSLDLTTLLTVPLHLALLGREREALRDPIAVLESIRRLQGRITVFAQRGRLQVPAEANQLFGLLEPLVVEVKAPRGGVFHPKLWVLRFRGEDEDEVLHRLLVLSRNLTADRSWDVCLALEGRPGKRNVRANRPLADLVRGLPELALQPPEPARVEQARRLGEELGRVRWDPPPGVDSIEFDVLGLDGRQWNPPSGRRALVVSPFCTETGLAHLCRSVQNSVALVSRPETFGELAADTRSRFGRCLVLDEAAETEDGEELAEEARDTFGLHAKLFLFDQGWDACLVVGSANATSAALVDGRNVEVVARLVGKKSKIGIDKLLADDGLGALLVEAPSDPAAPEVDAAEQAAQEALDAARRHLAECELRLDCAKGDGGGWLLELRGLPARPAGIAKCRVWPITVTADHAIDLWSSDRDERVCFPDLAAGSLTGLTAFELEAEVHPTRRRFVLNLPVDGLPEERDAAILRTVVSNRDAFLRYLLLLLGELGAGLDVEEGGGGAALGAWGDGFDGMPLFEELVRAYSRTPERLEDVAAVIRRLQEAPGSEDVVPQEFLDLWSVFERAREATS